MQIHQKEKNPIQYRSERKRKDAEIPWNEDLAREFNNKITTEALKTKMGKKNLPC